jgi:hypothetical protein
LSRPDRSQVQRKRSRQTNGEMGEAKERHIPRSRKPNLGEKGQSKTLDRSPCRGREDYGG